MSEGLSVSDIVNVDVNLSPIAAGTRNFGSLLLLGNTPTIAVGEDPREYSQMEGVAADFGVNDPEYQAAAAFFAQSPKPNFLYIARWAATAAAAKLNGGFLADAAPGDFTGISDGELSIEIDSVLVTANVADSTSIDLAGETSLNGVASAIQTALSAFSTGAEVIWNSSFSRFEVTSGTTGVTSTIAYATPTAGTGTDLAPLLGLTVEYASAPFQGVDAQELDQAVQDQANRSTAWYGLALAAEATDDAIVATADVIEAQGTSRIFGVTTQDPQTVDSTIVDDLASRLMEGGYARTAIQYSSSDPYAFVSAMGRAFTVNYTAQNTVITLKFKQEPGTQAELLNTTQARTLADKNCNVFVKYNNATAILQEGVMCNGDYFDERHGLDWLQNYIQTNLYNLLYTSQTKIPQTDPGVNQLQTNVERSCAQAVVNGLLAAGVWQSTVVFGSLHTGDTLPKGYYTYAAPIRTQSASDRAARKSPAIQVAAKLAGAVHSVDVIVNVNR